MHYDVATLRHLIDDALHDGDAGPLEHYLLANADDPGVSEVFAGAIATIVTAPDPPVERIEALLDGWAALSLRDAPRDDPRARLPATALRSYGAVAVARPDWWDDEIAKLRRGTADRRPWSQASVWEALRQMLAADPERTRDALVEWRASGDPQAARVAIAVLTMAELG
jgi:hypothetical protein